MLKVIYKAKGVVHEVFEKTFCATLYDLLDRSMPDEYAEIKTKYVPEEYRKYIEPGALFYWTISTEKIPNKKQERAVHEIKFNTEIWTAALIAKAKREGKKLYKELNRGR